jgi:Glycosyltransferase family 87
MRFAAVVGILVGIEAAIVHLTLDPLGDVHAYYDAGARLNAGEPLYIQAAGIDDASFYRYPPLLAILFRPLALLPYETAAVIWATVIVGATLLTIRRLGYRESTFMVAAWLAAPLAWTVIVGQAQALVTFLLALGSPWAVAFAANIKVFPALVAIYWIGRREWRALGFFAAWMAGLVAFQFVVEPEATLDYLGFLSLDQVGQVANISLYAISPVLWVISVVVLTVVALRLAPTRWGWAAAVVLSVFATPRLLMYQLSTLLAGLGGPREEAE